MKHSELVSIARLWLCRFCPVVITEMATSGEIPDAIGWQGGFSTMIECKVSLEDFNSEQCYRKNQTSCMGQQRYYLVPSGLVPESKLPDAWGLLELTGCGVRKTKESGIFSGDGVNFGAERRLLVSAIRRVFKAGCADGVNVKCYTIHPNGNTMATLTANANLDSVCDSDFLI